MVCQDSQRVKYLFESNDSSSWSLFVLPKEALGTTISFGEESLVSVSSILALKEVVALSEFTNFYFPSDHHYCCKGIYTK